MNQKPFTLRNKQFRKLLGRAAAVFTSRQAGGTGATRPDWTIIQDATSRNFRKSRFQKVSFRKVVPAYK